MKKTKLCRARSAFDQPRERRKAAKRVCIRFACCRQPRKGRRVCDTCDSREKFARNPLLRFFHNLKTHAKARGKKFALTWEWFRDFAERHDLRREIYGRGRGMKTIDRIDHRRGYEPGNLQILTGSENAAKGWAERHGMPWPHREGDPF